MDEIDTHSTRMLNKEVYNKTGLIHGIGHAVYTVSDPRALLLKELARGLTRERGKEREFAFLELLEERAIEVFGRMRNNGKTVSSNAGLYSGFVYKMIGLPQEIFTPLSAMARIVGWCAHHNEELSFEGKRIIRPAHKNVLEEVAYTPIRKWQNLPEKHKRWITLFFPTWGIFLSTMVERNFLHEGAKLSSWRKG